MNLYDTIDATWAPEEIFRKGPFVFRRGAGGGQRVSAANLVGQFTKADLGMAEDTMRGMDQRPIFMIRDGDGDLDAALADRGYRIKDPVVLYLAPVRDLTSEAPQLSGIECATPLAIQREIWAAGGIGPERLAVMDRVRVPKTFLLGRAGDRAAGAAFVGVENGVAMLHALEVAKGYRGQGVARNMLAKSISWALTNGAENFATLVTSENSPARRLYRSLGMQENATYHYRT